MNCFAIKDYWMYLAVFYMCRAMGVLPLVERANIISSVHICESYKGCYHLSRWGILFNIAHILLLLLCGYHLNIEWNNLLTMHAMFWIQNISAACLSLFLTLMRLSSLLDHISTACTVYYLYSHKTKTISFFLIFLLVQPFIPMFYQLFWLPFLDSNIDFYFLELNYVSSHTVAVGVVISTLCFIATNAYVEINQNLISYQKLMFDSKLIILVKHNLENYIFVSKFARSFSSHFSPNFLNTFICLITRTIVFVVFSVQRLKAGKINEIILYAFTNVYVVFCVFFVCYCCQKVKNEQLMTLIILRRNRVLWIDKLTEDEEFLLDTYEELMEMMAVEFTACGLFPVNVEHCLHVLGIIITYGLAAAQA